MKNFNRSSQGGSAVVFALVGAAMVIGLITLVYVVKIRGNQVRKEQAIATYEQQKSKETKADNNPAEASKPSSDAKVPDKPNISSGSSTNIPTSGRLPDTGSGLELVQLVGIGLVSIAISAFLSSSRHLVRYL